MRAVPAHVVSNEFKHLPHAILGHLLFRFLELLKLCYQSRKNCPVNFAFPKQGNALFEQFSLRLTTVLHQKLDYSSEFFDGYLMGGKSLSGRTKGGSSYSFVASIFVDLGSFRRRTGCCGYETCSSLLLELSLLLSGASIWAR